jgi:hypothetical protein
LSEAEELGHLPQGALRQPRRRRAKRRGGWARRVFRAAVTIKLALLIFFSLAVGALYFRLSQAPLRFEGLRDQVTAALEIELGEGWRISINDAALTLVDGSLGMKVSDLELHDDTGALVAIAPQALIPLSVWSLVGGTPQPTGLDLVGVELRMRLAADGSLSLSSPTGSGVQHTGLKGDIHFDDAPMADVYRKGVANVAQPMPSFLAPPELAVALANMLGGLAEPSGPIGGLQHVGLRDARLTMIDETARERVAFTRVDADLRSRAGGRDLALMMEGEHGQWHVTGRVAERDGGGYEARLAIADIPFSDLLLISGLSARFDAQEMHLEAEAEMVIGSDHAIEAFEAQLRLAPGLFAFDDPEAPVLNIGDFESRIVWEPETERISIPRLAYSRGGTRVDLSGSLVPDPGGEDWIMRFQGRDSILSGATPNDPPVRIALIDIDGRVGPQGIRIDDMTVRGEELDVALAMSFAGPHDQGGIRLAMEARNTEVRTALRVWPRFSAHKPREFLVDTLDSGQLHSLSLQTTLTGEDFEAMRREEGLRPESLAVHIDIRNARFRPHPELPPLEDAHVAGFVGGRVIDISDAYADMVMQDGRRLALTDVVFSKDDYWDGDERAALGLRLRGGADALASLLNTPLVGAAGAEALDPDALFGNASLDVALAISFDADPGEDQIPVAVTGSLTGIALPDVFAGEDLSEGNFQVTFRNGDLELAGEARLGGDPVELHLTQRPDAPVSVEIATMLDASARARRGIRLGGGLTGDLPLVIRTVLDPEAPQDLQIEADLTPARIDGLVPGLSKPRGQAGRLSFTLREGDGWLLDSLSLEIGATRISGSLELDADGQLLRGAFDRLQISSGDDARATLRRENGALRVDLRAATLDARPFIADLELAGGDTGGDDLDLDLRADILTGHNGEALTNARVTLSLRNGRLLDMTLDGRFPGAAITGRQGLTAAGEPVISIRSEDAGATLRFVDLYTRMGGGAMTLDVASEGARRPGRLVVRDFVLRDEPALRRIVSQVDARTLGDDQTDTLAARFSQARADFAISGRRIDLEEAALWGTEVGFRLDGYVDLARRVVDLSGTFTPAYGLNNAFAQVPLFGPILGGNRREGLIGVNFRVAGSMDEPVLTVNPLSAIAPGFLRRLFSAGGQAPPAPPQSAVGLPPLPRAPLDINPQR